jgi:hypothetical protein
MQWVSKRRALQHHRSAFRVRDYYALKKDVVRSVMSQYIGRTTQHVPPTASSRFAPAGQLNSFAAEPSAIAYRDRNTLLALASDALVPNHQMPV